MEENEGESRGDDAETREKESDISKVEENEIGNASVGTDDIAALSDEVTENVDEGEKKKDEEESERKAREALMSDEEKEQKRNEAAQLKAKGNEQFGLGNWQAASEIYGQALDACPLEFVAERSTYYSNRAAAFMKLSDFKTAVNDCTKAIELGASNDKALERRAYCYAQEESDFELAVKDYALLAEKYPRNRTYRERIEKLEADIKDRNERMKQDMIEKLKNLGNMCLRPFGLSTDNFQLVPQADGGYSISMKK